MSIDSLSWEHHLVMRAHNALDNRTPSVPVDVDIDLLQTAYDHCAEVTRQHSKTFFLASSLLPYEQRQASRSLYAFCRISDDLVDRGTGDRLVKLLKWKQISLSDIPNPDNLIALAWAATRAKYHIPRQYAEQLLDGVALDLTKSRFKTFDELAHYCYGVASTVGLMTMHIVGYSGQEAIPYAIKLGVALQLTNILRDIGEDWQNGRFYLPLDELASFNLSEQDIADGNLDERWTAFMAFQIKRTRQLYEQAMPGIAMLGKSGRFAIAAAAELYAAILTDIEAHQYDNLNRRAFISKRQKLVRLPGIWYRARFNRYQAPAIQHASMQTEIDHVAWQG